VRDTDENRQINLPPWAKLAITVTGTTVTTIVAMFLWATSTFVSRVEYSNHASQQAVDMASLKEVQKSYATAEAGTSATLSDLKVDVAEVKKDVSWIRQAIAPEVNPQLRKR
jgi:hypothetical protein